MCYYGVCCSIQVCICIFVYIVINQGRRNMNSYKTTYDTHSVSSCLYAKQGLRRLTREYWHMWYIYREAVWGGQRLSLL